VVQTKYKPDGWLGFLRGPKMYYDITSVDGLQEKMTDLQKALGNKGKLLVHVSSTNTYTFLSSINCRLSVQHHAEERITERLSPRITNRTVHKINAPSDVIKEYF
jgi:hypothetical protein